MVDANKFEEEDNNEGNKIGGFENQVNSIQQRNRFTIDIEREKRVEIFLFFFSSFFPLYVAQTDIGW